MPRWPRDGLRGPVGSGHWERVVSEMADPRWGNKSVWVAAAVGAILVLAVVLLVVYGGGGSGGGASGGGGGGGY